MYSRFLVTPPTQEPLTIDEIRRHVRVDALNKEPVPDAPTVALAGIGAGNVDNGPHRYRVTFVTADGETDGGTISTSVTVADKTVDGQVALSAIPLGGSRVTARKLYRTIAAGSVYLFLATLADNTTTVYSDNTADASLGVAAPATNTTLDPELLALQSVARERIETMCGRAMLTQTWRATLDHFPLTCWAPNWYGLYAVSAYAPLYESLSSYLWNFDEIPLPMPVLQSVSSITYVEPNGATQTLSPSLYSVDTDSIPGRVILAFGQSWPATRMQKNAVTITFVAGYANAGLVPARWKHAIKLLIGHWYQNRELLGATTEQAIPESVWDLMSPETTVAV